MFPPEFYSKSKPMYIKLGTSPLLRLTKNLIPLYFEYKKVTLRIQIHPDTHTILRAGIKNPQIRRNHSDMPFTNISHIDPNCFSDERGGGEFAILWVTFLYSKYKGIRFLVSRSKGDVPNFIYIGFDLL